MGKYRRVSALQKFTVLHHEGGEALAQAAQRSCGCPLPGREARLKARLDGALSTLGWWKTSLLMAGGLEPDDLQGPFQPKPFYGYMIL